MTGNAEADVIVIGAGALALFAARRAQRAGLTALRVGTGTPFERFLLLHENALRALERNYGAAPGRPLRGIRVLNADLRPLRTLDVAAHGLRLHGLRYSALLDFLHRHDEVEAFDARVESLAPDGAVRLADGRLLRARRLVVNTAVSLRRGRPWLHHEHAKPFRLGFVPAVVDAEHVVQINDAGTYAIIVPMPGGGEGESALACSGDLAPVERLFGRPLAAHLGPPVKLVSWCHGGMRQGQVVHVGEAQRRMHPHTGQGLNRALDVIDALFADGGLRRAWWLDCAYVLGGLVLDAIWGRHPRLRDLTYALAATSFGLRLMAGLSRP